MPLIHIESKNQLKERMRNRSNKGWNVEDLGSDDPSIIKRLYNRLPKMGDSVLPVLIEHISNPNPLVRCRIAWLLGMIGGELAYDYLVQLMGDGAYEVQYDAILAIGKIRDARAIPYLLNVLYQDDDTYGLSSASAMSLTNFSDLILSELIDKLSTSNISLRNRLIDLLGRTKSQLAEEPLKRMLLASEVSTRVAAIEALVNLKSCDFCSDLSRLSNDPMEEVADVANYWFSELRCKTLE